MALRRASAMQGGIASSHPGNFRPKVQREGADITSGASALKWVLFAAIGLWLAAGLLAICACIAGARGERRLRYSAEAEAEEQVEQRRRSIRAAML